MVAHALRAEGFDASEDGTERGTPLVPVVFKVRGGVEREDGSRGSTNIGKQAGKGYLGSEERAFTQAAAQDQFVAQPVAFHANAQACQLPGPDRDTSISDSLTRSQQAAVAQPITQFGNIAGSLTARHDSSPCADRGQNVVAQPIPIHDQATRHAGKRGEHSDGKGNGLGIGQPGDPAPTLTKGDKHAVAQPVAPALTASNDPSRSPQSSEVTQQVAAVHAVAMQVRRLTPVECERLQGFPDGYTNIPWRKKDEAPDGPRYKALGNSMAVPCMAWIGKRIAEVDNDPLA
jgi:DNA (cytosine-5)-methyltransferase 1